MLDVFNFTGTFAVLVEHSVSSNVMDDQRKHL